MKHSHNAYWCEKPIEDSFIENCSILEADIMYKNNDVYLSHSWRPWTALMYGTLEDVFLKPLMNIIGSNPQAIYVYIEFKSNNTKILPQLGHLLTKYSHPKLIYLLGATDRYWFQKRENIMNKFYNLYKHQSNIFLWNDFTQKIQIERLDLFKPHWNHF